MTSIVLWSSGDILCQAFLHRFNASSTSSRPQINQSNGKAMAESDINQSYCNQKTSFWSSWNHERTFKQGFIGGLLLGPSLHFFFTRIIPRVTFPNRSHAFNVFMRVAAQQTCTMPLFQFYLLFTPGFLEPAESLEARLEKGLCRFKDKWRSGFATSLTFWPTMNLVMYGLVPPRFFNLYADMAGILFAAAMSYIANNNNDTP